LFLKSSVSLNFSQFIQYINRIGFEFWLFWLSYF
jgi:hypothetical protein